MTETVYVCMDTFFKQSGFSCLLSISFTDLYREINDDGLK